MTAIALLIGLFTGATAATLVIAACAASATRSRVEQAYRDGKRQGERGAWQACRATLRMQRDLDTTLGHPKARQAVLDAMRQPPHGRDG